MAAPFQQKIDDFLNRVYSRGGGVASNWDGPDDSFQLAIVSLPGILTKFVPLEDSIQRLDQWELDYK